MANDVIPFESLTKEMAAAYQIEPAELISTVKAMCFDKGAASDPQLFVFLTLAKRLELNPFNREIYAFIANGKMQTIVGFDGWVKLSVRHPMFGGFEFFDHTNDKGELTAITCRMWRKDWQHSAEATEYLEECRGTTDPWKKWPHRMLRNKAYVQCARMTFGFAGVIDPDEYERIAAPANWKDQSIEIESRVVAEQQTQRRESPQEHGTPHEGIAGQSPIEGANPSHPTNNSDSGAARDRLKEVFNEHQKRVTMQLGKVGKTSIDELSDDEVGSILTKTDK
jgi:RecT family